MACDFRTAFISVIWASRLETTDQLSSDIIALFFADTLLIESSDFRRFRLTGVSQPKNGLIELLHFQRRKKLEGKYRPRMLDFADIKLPGACSHRLMCLCICA